MPPSATVARCYKQRKKLLSVIEQNNAYSTALHCRGKQSRGRVRSYPRIEFGVQQLPPAADFFVFLCTSPPHLSHTANSFPPPPQTCNYPHHLPGATWCVLNQPSPNKETDEARGYNMQSHNELSPLNVTFLFVSYTPLTDHLASQRWGVYWAQEVLPLIRRCITMAIKNVSNENTTSSAVHPTPSRLTPTRAHKKQIQRCLCENLEPVVTCLMTHRTSAVLFHPAYSATPYSHSVRSAAVPLKGQLCVTPTHTGETHIIIANATALPSQGRFTTRYPHERKPPLGQLTHVHPPRPSSSCPWSQVAVAAPPPPPPSQFD